MGTTHHHTKPPPSIDQVIEEALRREQTVREYYRSALESVGPDAKGTLAALYHQEDERIAALRLLLTEIRELRDLSIPMVG